MTMRAYVKQISKNFYKFAYTSALLQTLDNWSKNILVQITQAIVVGSTRANRSRGTVTDNINTITWQLFKQDLQA